MSKKNVNLRHFDEWSKQIKRFGEDVEFTGVFFKHGKPLYVQRMVGQVAMDFSSTLPDGVTFTSRSKQFASWNAEGQCFIKRTRCKIYDVFPAEG